MVTVIRNGLSNFRGNLAVWAGMYLVRLLLALLFTMPFLIMVDSGLTNSDFAQALFGEWALDVVLEYFMTHENVLTVFLVLLMFQILLSFLVKQFLNGGIYYTYLSQKPARAGRFFAEAGVLFRGNLKISLAMIPVYLAIVMMATFFISFLPDGLFGHFGTDVFENIIFRGAFLYLFLIVGTNLSESLRLRLTAYPDETLGESLRSSVGFWRANFVKLFGIHLVYWIPFVIVWFLVEKLALLVTGGLGNLAGIVIELILFQACAFLHVGQSLVFSATVAPLFRAAHPGRFQDIVQGELRLD